MPSLRDLAELVRAPAALSVPGDAIAGAAASGAFRPPVPGSRRAESTRLAEAGRTAGLAAGAVCLYWAGMAANDWADRDLDAVERPERPIPSGRVSPAAAVTVAAGLTAAGLGLAAVSGGRRAVAVAAPLAGAVWAYDVVAKHTRAGPAVMAACRGLDVLLGASRGRLSRAVPAAATVAAHTYTVTTLSRHEVASTTGPALPAATLAGTGAVALAAGGRGGAVPAALATWYAAGYGGAQSRALADPSAARVRAAVGAGIVGLPPLQGALVARAGARVAGVAVAAATVLARRLTRRVSPT